MTLAMAGKLKTRYYQGIMLFVIIMKNTCCPIYECLLKYSTDKSMHTQKV